MNNAWTDEKIIKLLRSRLDDYRFNHSLNVADSAKELAEIYGADPKKCFLKRWELRFRATKKTTESFGTQ